MPPRLPRVFSTLPFGPNSVASSSTHPPPPPAVGRRADSPELLRVRHIHTSDRLPPTHPLQRCSRRASNPALNRGQSKHGFHSSASASASAKDPYEVLGVKKGSSQAEIKKIYYQLAKKWHPDTNKDKGAQERFMEIQTAYDILSDDKKREAYDRYGSASTQEGFDPDMFARGAGGFGGFQDFGGFGGRPGNAADLFEQLFGGAFGGGAAAGGSPFGAGTGQRQRNVKGDDLEATVNLSFLEACKGVNRKLTITPVVDCKPCSGSGLKPGEKKSQCTTCRGTGQQTFQIQGMFMASTCQACGGAGSTIPRNARCGECEGVGRVKERKEVTVEIPAGVEDGMKVKLSNMGDMPLSNTGPPGDLYVRINVSKSNIFRRQGTNIYHDAKVPLHTALLGGKVRIPTLEGDVEVRVREGTQNGEEAVLKGRGVQSVYGAGARAKDRGDLVVGWKVQIPRALTSFQKKIMQAYADDVEGRPSSITFGPSPPPPSSVEPPHPDAASPSSASSLDRNPSETNGGASSGKDDKVTPSPEHEHPSDTQSSQAGSETSDASQSKATSEIKESKERRKRKNIKSPTGKTVGDPSQDGAGSSGQVDQGGQEHIHGPPQVADEFEEVEKKSATG